MNGRQDAAETPKLIIVGGYEGFHLVSRSTIQRASEEVDRAEQMARCDDFGELRRSGDVDQLEDALHAWGISIDDYVTAIERSASLDGDRTSAISVRLAALDNVDFDGDDDLGAPGDDESLPESDDDVEDVYSDVIAKGMVDDVPDEILERFELRHQPMFQSDPIAFVPSEQLDSVVEALTAAGYRVLEEDET